ncbi:hypothetical protein FOFC_10525 [Fusarium oxysporum]|nr:hypothetical protein FOFC_10525 [Fusarium oxysporum]
MMSRNILITGAAGYIVGSIVANLLSKHPETTKQQVFAAVRTDEQAKALSTLGINVLKVDLSDEQTVVNEISSHKSNNLIVTEQKAYTDGLYFAFDKCSGKTKGQTSGLSAFYANSGWPRTVNKDTDAVFETEKEFADSYPIRKTDVMVIEYAQAQGVTPFVIVPSIVYGRGTGAWNQLSVMSLQAVHISGLTALYCRIIHAALKNEEISSGKEGYYSAVAHETNMWEFQDHLAAAMKARGLVSSNKPEMYPSDEFAADAINVPVEFLGALYKSG